MLLTFRFFLSTHIVFFYYLQYISDIGQMKISVV